MEEEDKNGNNKIQEDKELSLNFYYSLFFSGPCKNVMMHLVLLDQKGWILEDSLFKIAKNVWQKFSTNCTRHNVITCCFYLFLVIDTKSWSYSHHSQECVWQPLILFSKCMASLIWCLEIAMLFWLIDAWAANKMLR